MCLEYLNIFLNIKIIVIAIKMLIPFGDIKAYIIRDFVKYFPVKINFKKLYIIVCLTYC